MSGNGKIRRFLCDLLACVAMLIAFSGAVILMLGVFG